MSTITFRDFVSIACSSCNYISTGLLSSFGRGKPFYSARPSLGAPAEPRQVIQDLASSNGICMSSSARRRYEQRPTNSMMHREGLFCMKIFASADDSHAVTAVPVEHYVKFRRGMKVRARKRKSKLCATRHDGERRPDVKTERRPCPPRSRSGESDRTRASSDPKFGSLHLRVLSTCVPTEAGPHLQAWSM